MLKRVKRIRSHKGHAHLLAVCDEQSIGTISRQSDIASPYHYSRDWSVWNHETFGPVVVVETSHRCFDVFSVPKDMIEPIVEPEQDCGDV